ncbi:hypothetical protein BGT96224_Ac30889 [Blumeria graminis f. sp. tritici 96224]|uniref:Uncharacterized protein n=2 Tax=Blumeria graminis f. sp. tritici 96224 TaxID=1268274 RepID=A0A656KFF7_BLUGR|nr:hypothetical protein BGT96224_Ac30889 [Blumeria graminis f. sp. tritici 96224]
MKLTTLEDSWQMFPAEWAQTEFVLGFCYYKEKNAVKLQEARVKLQTPELAVSQPEARNSNESPIRQLSIPAPISVSSINGYYTEISENLLNRSPYPKSTSYAAQFHSK